jgi:hypothetical protein
MRPDMSEFAYKEPPRAAGLELAKLVMGAVAIGSRVESPLFHLSWEFYGAREWMVMHRQYGRTGTPQLCRISVDALRVLVLQGSSGAIASVDDADLSATVGDGPLGDGRVLDLSNQARARRCLGRWASESCIEEMLPELRKAYSKSEVLLTWRGRIDKSFWEVIDETRGHCLWQLGVAPEVPTGALAPFVGGGESYWIVQYSASSFRTRIYYSTGQL